MQVDDGRARFLERAVVALAFLTIASFFPWFEPLHSPNELTRIYLASALVEDGTVCIDPQIQKNGGIFDISVRDGKTYSDKAPGVAFLSVPVIAAYEALTDHPTLSGKVRLVRLVVSTLPTLLLLFWMLRFLREHIPDRGLRLALVTAYALGTVATAYSGLAFGHQLSAVVLFGLFLLIRKVPLERPPSIPRLMSIGVVTAFAVWVEYQNVLLLVPLAGFFVWRARRSFVRSFAFAAAGAAPLIAVLLLYHKAAYGSPFLTGYSFIASSFKEVHKQGLLGVALPKATHAWLSFLSPAKGIFFFAPWLALVIPATIVAWRKAGSDGRVSVLIIVLYALFVSALVYPDGGWTMSQRHLVPMIPFVVMPVGLLIQRVPALRIVFAGLALASIAACTTGAVVWPHYQDHLQNPTFQLGFPMLRDGWVPTSIVNVLDLRSKTFLIALMAIAALVVVAGTFDGLLQKARRIPLLVVATLAAFAIAFVYLSFASRPGAAQDVRGDRAWVETVYDRDWSS